MKKVLSIIMTVSMILSCAMLYSCGSTQTASSNNIGNDAEKIVLQPYEIYGESIDSDSGSLISLQTNALPNNWVEERGEHQDDTAQKTITVEVLGKKYTYQYSKSKEYALYKNAPGNQVQHYYGDHFDGNVTVNAQTNQVISWQAPLPGPSVHDSIFRTDADLNRLYDMDADELQKIAEEYAKELIGKEQLSKYEFVIEESSVCFFRMINGEKTNEYIRLVLQSDGDLHSFVLMNIGMFNHIDDFKFDNKKAVEQIEKKLANAYGDVEYSIKSINKTVLMLPNGQCAYQFDINTQYSLGEANVAEDVSGTFWMSQMFEFIIPAE